MAFTLSLLYTNMFLFLRYYGEKSLQSKTSSSRRTKSENPALLVNIVAFLVFCFFDLINQTFCIHNICVTYQIIKTALGRYFRFKLAPQKTGVAPLSCAKNPPIISAIYPNAYADFCHIFAEF